MSTLTLPNPSKNHYRKLYRSMFTKMHSEFLTIPKPYQTIHDIQFISSLHLYWNHYVQVGLHWRKLAEQELDYPTRQKMNKYIKEVLIRECRKVITELKRCSVTTSSMEYKRDILITELKDRILYMHTHY